MPALLKMKATRIGAMWLAFLPGVVFAAPALVDLDGDGTPETNLLVAPCSAHHELDCLLIDRAHVHSEVALTDQAAIRNPFSTDVHLQGPRIVVIGNHTGTPLAEVAVLTAERDAKQYHGVLNVVDVDAHTVVGRARSPIGLFNVFVDAAHGADGRRHPFLAPSFGASTHPAPELGTAGEWDYLCTFANGTNDRRCGSGFAAIDIGAGRSDDGTKPADYFREVGGYLQDIDGDGWEDVHLIYHGQIRTVSLAKRRLIHVVRYDIAHDAATINRTNFGVVAHSGRNYGTHTAAQAPAGVLRSVMVAGGEVDAFGMTDPSETRTPRDFRDLFCNVSRFIGVIESQPGMAETRRLKWSRYFGFDSSTFAFPPDLSTSAARVRPLASRLRTGDFMDGCIHRFSDSRIEMDGRRAIAVDVFHALDVQRPCVPEQYQLYFDGWSEGFAVPNGASAQDAKPWSAAKERAWHACKAQNVRSRGTWRLELYDEGSGAQLAAMTGGYIWGWSYRIVPGAVVYLQEPLDANAPFDFTWDFANDRPRAPTSLTFRTLSEGKWQRRLPVPAHARPAIAKQPASGPRGLGDYSYYAEWVTADIDGDGLDDVKLTDGSWIGWVRSANRFACKRDCTEGLPSSAPR
jgi:hypothetical protein